MGMFDELVVAHHDLPGCTSHPPHTLQTKNFNCLLEWYSIGQDDRLYFHKTPDDIDPDDRHLAGRPGSPGIILEDMYFHGIITAIDIDYTRYEFKFTDGILVNIKRI
jgi:hypothetical protein